MTFFLYLDCIKKEIKGADLRKQIRKSRNQSRHALGFLNEVLRLLEKYNARIMGRIWIKGIGTPLNGKKIYAYTMQQMATHFQHFLDCRDENGILIADFRDAAIAVRLK